MSKLSFLTATVAFLLATTHLKEIITFDVEIGLDEIKKALHEYNEDDQLLNEATKQIREIAYHTKKFASLKTFKKLHSQIMAKRVELGNSMRDCLEDAHRSAQEDTHFKILQAVFENLQQLGHKYPDGVQIIDNLQSHLEEAHELFHTLRLKYQGLVEHCQNDFDQTSNVDIVELKNQIKEKFGEDLKRSIDKNFKWLTQREILFHQMPEIPHFPGKLPFFIIEFIKSCFMETSFSMPKTQPNSGVKYLDEKLYREVNTVLSIDMLISHFFNFVTALSKKFKKQQLDFTIQAQSVTLSAESERFGLKGRKLTLDGANCSVYKSYENLEVKMGLAHYNLVRHGFAHNFTVFFQQEFFVLNPESNYKDGSLSIDRYLTDASAQYFMLFSQRPEWYYVSECKINLWGNGKMGMILFFSRKSGPQINI